jgi:hypothetical protein
MALRLLLVSMFNIIILVVCSATVTASGYDCSKSLSIVTAGCKMELQRVISTGDKSLIANDCCLQLVCINEATCASFVHWICLDKVHECLSPPSMS